MMPKKSAAYVIYMIQNRANDKRYIGHAANWPARRSQHRNVLRQGKHGNSLLQREWGAFGEFAFDFSVIAEARDKREAQRIENWQINRYNTIDSRSGYNQMVDGRWSPEASVRDTEEKLIRNRKYERIPGTDSHDPMAFVFLKTAMKGHRKEGWERLW